MSPEVIKLYQTMLAQHQGNASNALLDLSHRYLYALEGLSPGYMRWGLDDGKEIKLDPPPVDDGSWLATGREA